MIKSLCTITYDQASLESIASWIETRNREVSVERIPFKAMDNWEVLSDISLCHSSGKFFTIKGIKVRTDYPAPDEWE